MSKSMQNNSRSIIETILVLLLLLSLMLALYDVLKVFFGVLTFALIFSVSFSDIFERLVRLLGNRRKLAAVVYSILLVAVVALPVILIVGAVRAHIREAIEWIGRIRASGIPPLSDWIIRLPVVGPDIQAFWQQLQDSPRDTLTHHEEQVRMLLRHALASGVGMISTILQVVVGIVISAFFLVSGDKIMQPIKATVAHLLGRRDGLTLLAATTQAIRGVSIGMMGTAFIASILAWIGLAIAGVSFSLILAGAVFFLVLIQVGPLLVWVPLVIWSAMQGHTAMTVFLIIYGIALLVVDGFLKPVLIARSGGKLPFLVMFLGVIGGLAAWGFTGMFKGAIIMAVFYTLFTSWLQKKRMAAS
jgi:predicted PurR-regulated permease PerM